MEWHNHEAIIPNDLFMYAYNRISQADFYGEPNPHYVPYRPWIRHNKADRSEAPPTYTGAVYSDDLPDKPHKRLGTTWKAQDKRYEYLLFNTSKRSSLWNIRAFILDSIVDRMLLERLKATTIDEAVWQAALVSTDDGSHAEVRRLETAIKQAEQTKDNLIASLGLLNNGDMIARTQARYEATEREIDTLKVQLAQLKSGQKKQVNLAQARPVLETVIAHWDDVPRQERRSLFDAFADHIKVNKNAHHTKTITVYWRDGSTTSKNSPHKSKGYFWEEDALEKLKAMVEGDVDQWEILKAFPDYTWKALQERYAYRYGNGRWRTDYAGQKPYSRYTRWRSTEECKAEKKHPPQLKPSECCTGRQSNGRWLRSFGKRRTGSPG